MYIYIYVQVRPSDVDICLCKNWPSLRALQRITENKCKHNSEVWMIQMLLLFSGFALLSVTVSFICIQFLHRWISISEGLMQAVHNTHLHRNNLQFECNYCIFFHFVSFTIFDDFFVDTQLAKNTLVLFSERKRDRFIVSRTKAHWKSRIGTFIGTDSVERMNKMRTDE